MPQDLPALASKLVDPGDGSPTTGFLVESSWGDLLEVVSGVPRLQLAAVLTRHRPTLLPPDATGADLAAIAESYRADILSAGAQSTLVGTDALASRYDAALAELRTLGRLTDATGTDGGGGGGLGGGSSLGGGGGSLGGGVGSLGVDSAGSESGAGLGGSGASGASGASPPPVTGSNLPSIADIAAGTTSPPAAGQPTGTPAAAGVTTAPYTDQPPTGSRTPAASAGVTTAPRAGQAVTGSGVSAFTGGAPVGYRPGQVASVPPQPTTGSTGIPVPGDTAPVEDAAARKAELTRAASAMVALLRKGAQAPSRLGASPPLAYPAHPQPATHPNSAPAPPVGSPTSTGTPPRQRPAAHPAGAQATRPRRRYPFAIAMVAFSWVINLIFSAAYGPGSTFTLGIWVILPLAMAFNKKLSVRIREIVAALPGPALAVGAFQLGDPYFTYITSVLVTLGVLYQIGYVLVVGRSAK